MSTPIPCRFRSFQLIGGYWTAGHLPAARHGGSGVISYTDGHAEIHRWRDGWTLASRSSNFLSAIRLIFHNFLPAEVTQELTFPPCSQDCCCSSSAASSAPSVSAPSLQNPR